MSVAADAYMKSGTRLESNIARRYFMAIGDAADNFIDTTSTNSLYATN
jgi:hypothetical protein